MAGNSRECGPLCDPDCEPVDHGLGLFVHKSSKLPPATVLIGDFGACPEFNPASVAVIRLASSEEAALTYAKDYWKFGQEPATQHALTVLRKAVERLSQPT